MSNNENNRINADFMPGCGSKDSIVSPSGLKNTLNVINNRAQYFAKIAQGCLEEVRTILAQVREYAAQNTNVTVEYVTNKIAELRNIIETALDNYLLKSNLNSELVAFGTAAQYVNSTQLSTAIDSVIPSQTNNKDKLLSTDGEDLCWVPVHHDYSIFDIIMKDYILSYSETKGFAQLGTYVYKEALAGSYYGYPDFYDQCVAEKTAGTATTATISGSTVTTYVHSNGHVYYDIADKAAFDSLYASTGVAWYYGIDTTNQRIFLPRNDYLTKYVANGNKNAKGTGISLGLTDGSTNYGIAPQANYWGIYATNSVYGASVGTGSSGYKNTNSALGITTDASKSGITTEITNTSNGMYVYMVVGNVSDWSGMTDVVNQGITILEQVNTGLSVKATKDLDNLTNAGKVMVSGLGMPSGTYTNLTLGASGTEYTAPANGWYTLRGDGSSSYTHAFMTNINNGLCSGYTTGSSGNANVHVWMAAQKGQKVQVDYSDISTLHWFRFIYAQGSESEAS